MRKLGVFFLACLSTVLYAYTFMCLFNWFITPFGMPELKMLQAYGVSIAITFLTGRVSKTEVDNQDTEHDIYISFAKSITFLIIGGIVHFAM